MQEQTIMNLLPPWLRQQITGRPPEQICEIRLRKNEAPALVTTGGEQWLTGRVRGEDLEFIINAASRYSPWAAESMAKGYLTAPGGHRIGICGAAVVHQGQMTGIRSVSSLCIRVAKEIRGAAAGIPLNAGSILILGPPASGKTTLLRDLIRRLSDRGPGTVAVVDEREELFPAGAAFDRGRRTDVLLGCPKAQGIEMALRTLGPSVIAVDEITAREDCEALLRACGCGTGLVATAHAGDIHDFQTRELYRPLAQSGLFALAVVMQPCKRWQAERLVP